MSRHRFQWWWGMAVLVLLSPSVASAGWSVNGSSATWSATGQLAIVQEARDAILWERGNHAFIGAIFTAATPNLNVVNNGDGTGSIRITVPRPAADNWLTAYGSNGGCGESPTQQQLLACSDSAILGDIKAIVKRFRQSQVASVEEPDLQ